MTWLGKILAFVVMIAAVAWMYFTVQAYATRTNWKTELEKWKAFAEKSQQSHREERTRNQSNEDALRRLIVIEQEKSGAYLKQVGVLENAAGEVSKAVTELQNVIANGDVKAVALQANIDGMLKELELVRLRNTDLENKTTKLVLDAEAAKREMVRAQNEAKLYRQNADDMAKKNEELLQKNSELRAGGGTLRGQLERPAPPLLANLRGEVEKVSDGGDLVTLSIGLDAGVNKGTILDLKRLTGGGKYLGTVKVLDVGHKDSVAVFIPADPRKRLAQLRPDELPRKGDLVEPSEYSPSGVLSTSR